LRPGRLARCDARAIDVLLVVAFALMSRQAPGGLQGRAVVIGASIAGLVAARALSECVDEVLIIERDRIDGQSAPRPGVPQAAHVHVLLRRGFVELTRQFPALDQRLAAATAPAVDLLQDSVWIMPAGVAPRVRSTLRTRSATRQLFESTIRDLTLERPNVRLMDGYESVGLRGDATAVSGVDVRARPARREREVSSGATQGPGESDASEDALISIDAWLVVDAAGRTSRAPEHLAAIGAPVPDESVVDASLRYATRLYRASDRPRDWKAMLIRDRPPSSTRGGVIFAVEDGRWVVTLGGAGVDQPPVDEDGFAEFARSLISPRLADAIRDAEPLSSVRGWARTANRWRHVERVRWPDGYAVMGDALCALNPVYGQGMSVAAMEGDVLRRWLDSPTVVRARRSSSAPDTGRLVRAFAGAARVPWFLATGEDARIDGVIGAAKPRVAEVIGRRYVDAVMLDAVRDARTLRRFSEVSNLVRPPFALFDPIVLARVMRGAMARWVSDGRPGPPASAARRRGRLMPRRRHGPPG
jgi:2-polyprenyl-6-methoxyphenol hydroxylase-like FAD-dependent oxidoreductase